MTRSYGHARDPARRDEFFKLHRSEAVMPERVPDEARYASGRREPITCPTCEQAAWRVYRGFQRNHVIEPRADIPIEAERLRALLAEKDAEIEQLRRIIADSRASAASARARWEEKLQRRARDV